MTRSSCLSLALPRLLVGLALYVTAQNAGSAEPPNPTVAANGSPPGVGVINEWLRDQSPACEPWDLGGQVRLRYENHDNAGSFPNRDFIRCGQDNDNAFLLLREKVHLGFAPESWARFFVEGRNATSDWDKRVPPPLSDKFDLHQAWVALGDPERCALTLKAGRQELSYGDSRVISASDWSNLERSFDAAKLRYESGLFWVDAFMGCIVLPNDNHFNEPNLHDLFSGVYGSTRKLVPWQDSDLYFLSRNVGTDSYDYIAQGFHGPRARDIYSIGMRWKSLPGRLGGWDYTLEAMSQFGSVSTGSSTPRLRQESYGVFAEVGRTWTHAWGVPRLGVGYEQGSGDSNSNDGKSQTLENLPGSPHRFYGQMDLFGPRNLHIPRVTASLKPLKELSITADYLLFWMYDTHDFLYPEIMPARSENGYGIHPGFNSFVGSEFDIFATYTLNPVAELQLGFGHFFVGDYIRQSVGSVPAHGGAADANWFYFQTRINL